MTTITHPSGVADRAVIMPNASGACPRVAPSGRLGRPLMRNSGITAPGGEAREMRLGAPAPLKPPPSRKTGWRGHTP
jgi:hypothetical protein